MNKNPKIKINHTKNDLFTEVTAFLLLIFFWIISILSLDYLPDEIPTHYDGSGQIDAFGDKEAILILPFITTLLVIMMSILSKFPHTFNYSVEITAENAEKQYRNAIGFIRMLKIAILLLFIFMNYQTMQIALEKNESLGVWFLPVTILFFITLVGYNLYKTYKINQESKI